MFYVYLLHSEKDKGSTSVFRRTCFGDTWALLATNREVRGSYLLRGYTERKMPKARKIPEERADGVSCAPNYVIFSA